MVSSQLSDALASPTRVLTELYNGYSGEDFPKHVATHFANVFHDERTFLQIPTLDLRHPPTSHGNRALVRFRAMVQDTSPSPEMYLSKLNSGGPGGWGIEGPPNDQGGAPLDYSVIRECAVIWAVSIPGESSWCAQELDGPNDVAADAASSDAPTQPPRSEKFPLASTPHIGVQAKLYDTSTSEALKSTDLVTFVGMLTHEPLMSEIENEHPVEVPTLHVLFTHPVSANLVRRTAVSTQDPTVEEIRDGLVGWIAEQALGGDKDAAEWVLLSSIARVQSRHPPILPPSIVLSHIPEHIKPSETASAIVDTQATETAPPSDSVPTLSHVLSTLLPLHVTLPLTIDSLNAHPYAPTSADEDLRSGALQLPAGTHVLLSETSLREGTLRAQGVSNLQAVQEAMAAQTLQYAFPFSAFAFPTDLSFLVLAQGKASAFFKTDISVRVHAREGADLYKSSSEVQLPPEERIARFRDLIIRARAAKVSVSEETSQYIQQDFVRERQQSKVTTDDLIHRMTVAKLVALSMQAKELTIDIWERAKKLDARRKELLGS